MSLPEAAQTAIRLGLPAHLNQLARCQQIGHAGLITCIYHMHKAAGGQEALLEQLQPESLSTVLSLVLDWINTPQFAELSPDVYGGKTYGVVASMGVCLVPELLFMHRVPGRVAMCI